MSEVRSNTIAKIVDGVATLNSRYQDNDSNIIKSVITNDSGYANGVRHVEGELLFSMMNYPSKIDGAVNSRGELVLIGNDLDRYSVSPDGDLLYTFEE